jgi:hypothetical protein
VSPSQTTTLTINYPTLIATNNLSFGYQISDTQNWAANNQIRDEVTKGQFKLVRIAITSDLAPCIRWDENTNTGTYNWAFLDNVVSSVESTGAELLFCVNRQPPGMDSNWLGTGFPNPENFAAYVGDLAQHTVQKGFHVKYWEIYNEAYYIMFQEYMVINQTRMQAFVQLYNNATQRLLNIIPGALVGTDSSRIRSFLEYFAVNAIQIGFLSFHKYDSYGTWLSEPVGYRSDDVVLNRASQFYDDLTPLQMQQICLQKRNQWIPVICSETNLNAATTQGTDPRIQQPIGVVWYAEVLRSFALNDVSYSIYFCASSTYAKWWDPNNRTGGPGFGMVESVPPYTQWYPYWLNYLISNNLYANDRIVDTSTSNFTAVSTLAWIRGDQLNILAICKTNYSSTISFKVNGFDNESLTASVDEINALSSGIQHSSVNVTNNIQIVSPGYSVILLSIPLNH